MRLAAAFALALPALAGDLDAVFSQAFGGRPGAGVVLEISSNRVLAAHRLPRAAARLAAPGSAIKPFTLLALEGAARLDRLPAGICPRELRIAGRNFHCSHPPADHPFSPAEALAYSCNHWFAQAALLLEPGALARLLERFGFGSPPGLAPGEAPGRVEVAATGEQLQLQALGSGLVEITPLALAAAYRKLALAVRSGPVRAGLAQAAEYGTARAAAPAGLAVLGKTGTTGVRQGGWAGAWFVGLAPAAAPEIVLVVFLERGSGGADAAPIAKPVFAAWQARRAGR
jgi:cell division protein FtsI/penicillin-binding protein 2